MPVLIETEVMTSESIEISPVQTALLTHLLPSYAYSQAIDVFSKHSNEVTFIPEGPGYRESPDVKEVIAGRVTGQVLHDKLVTPGNKSYFDSFYRGKLLDLTKSILRIPELYPADNPDDGYTGNALLEPKHRFPIHVDTKGTVSALVMYPVNQKSPMQSGGSFPWNYGGGELVFTQKRNIQGLRDLLQKPNIVIPPLRNDIMGVFFVGDIPHGSTSTDPRSVPRYSVACTYFLAGYGPESRSKAFRKTRSSVK